ncbi:MAG: alpha/beta hydrolase [Bryobacterales bacterium]|nr:alpha/beta hydrolase [Bryobacterales bacterium]
MQGDETLPTVALHSMETGADGPPLVFLHGVLRNGSCCTPMLAEFSVRHRVHALDLRGHGRSPGGDSYRVMDYLGDVVSYLRHHVPRPAILYGHSLGAMLAAGAAAYAPECVRGIVLEDPPFHTMGKRMRGTPLQDYFEGIRPFAGSSEPTGDLARQLSEVRVLSADKATRVPLGTLRDATALRFLASCLCHVRPEVLTPIIAGGWLDGYAMDEIFAGVRCPALLLQCDAATGGMLTEEDAERFASLAADCTRSYLKGVGHQAHWTQPGEVSRRTLEFLLSLEDMA